MRTYIFEGVQDIGVPLNWGKFLVGVPDIEWSAGSAVDPGSPYPLLQQIGWTPEHIWVMDLQTGEGALFNPNGNARADLDKHRIWVCPLFEEFLRWLYTQNIEALHLLPRVIELPDAQFSINGYRRLGPHDVSFTLRKGSLITIEWGGEPKLVVCEDVTDEGATIRSLTDEEMARAEQLLDEAETITLISPEVDEIPQQVRDAFDAAMAETGPPPSTEVIIPPFDPETLLVIGDDEQIAAAEQAAEE